MRLTLCLVVLFGFLASLGLQGLAEPDETPRAEIERLIGVDIASAMVMADPMGMCDSTSMAMPASHHMPKAGHHHHDTACALCPLLQLAVFILGVALLAAFSRSIRLTHVVSLPPCRAPPGLRWVLPPSQAPPVFLI